MIFSLLIFFSRYSLNIPYIPPNEHYLNIESIAELLPNLQYQVYFTHPKAEIELDKNVCK